MYKAKLFQFLFFIAVICFLVPSGIEPATAQTDEIIWSLPINISNTPDTSTDPFLLADPAGFVHLFWSEKMSIAPGNQPDTLMYANWDTQNWSQPVDLFFAPLSDGTPVIGYPHAVLDERGWIHLIWLSQPNFPNYSINYSSAPSWEANSSHAWTPQVTLANDLTGTKYSIHVAYNPVQGLHIVYARVPQGDNPREERTVTHIQSDDYGESWSEPRDIFSVADPQSGASDTRLLLVSPNKVFLSWTLWDQTGTGKAIYFVRSLDNGKSWDIPFPIATRLDGEYERDWNNLVYLDDGQLMAVWEGGFRAYRHAMYSSDDGETWSDPIDTFPWLIGENGFAEFAYDSNRTLHMFLAQRIREGSTSESRYEGREALWSSEWEGSTRWREPTLAVGSDLMTNPKAVIVNGNKVMTAWYGSHVYEIMVMNGEIQNAPAIAPIAWDKPVTPESSPPEPTKPILQVAKTPTPTQALEVAIDASTPNDVPVFNTIMIAAVPSIIIIIFIITLRSLRGR